MQHAHTPRTEGVRDPKNHTPLADARGVQNRPASLAIQGSTIGAGPDHSSVYDLRPRTAPRAIGKKDRKSSLLIPPSLALKITSAIEASTLPKGFAAIRSAPSENHQLLCNFVVLRQ